MVQPTTWAEALAAKAASTDLLPIVGGTDVMVELNFDRRRPAGLLDLTRVAHLREWSVADGTVELGAGVTYAQVIADLADLLPGLAMASRTVGSPQIRNRGTVGGNPGLGLAGGGRPSTAARRAGRRGGRFGPGHPAHPDR
jgi:CO/xanthine dehydrogenase FAD-binding subunit